MATSNTLAERECPRKTYKLIYHENDQGCGKRVELESRSFAEIIKMLRGDHAKREVDVFVDGKIACHIFHGEDAICVRRT